jgi:hypothetical protein
MPKKSKKKKEVPAETKEDKSRWKWALLAIAIIGIIIGSVIYVIVTETPLSISICAVTNGTMQMNLKNSGYYEIDIAKTIIQNSTIHMIAPYPEIRLPAGLTFLMTVPGNFTVGNYLFSFYLLDGSAVNTPSTYCGPGSVLQN